MRQGNTWRFFLQKKERFYPPFKKQPQNIWKNTMSKLRWYLSGARILKMLPDWALCHRLITFYQALRTRRYKFITFF
jgi:hypothetical protein